MKGANFIVEDSEYGHIEKGTMLSVERDHTNEFTGRRTITVSADTEIPNRITGSTFQLCRQPTDERWTEVHSGLSREHESVTLK